MIVIMSATIFDTLLASAAPPRTYAAGSYLFHRDDPVHSFHLLVEGAVRLIRHQENGGTLVLHAMSSPHIIAEASLYSRTYHCNCLCDSACSIASLPRSEADALISAQPDVAADWARYLATELQNARRHAEVLTHGKVAGRLDAWIAWHGPLPGKGEWKALAHYLSISPEALYREMARRNRLAERSATGPKAAKTP